MLEATRKALSIPTVPVQGLLTAGAVLGFGWLLLQDRVHALVIYLLQLYLTF